MSDPMKKSSINAIFGKHYGNKLYKLLDDCCDGKGSFCSEVKDCLEISPSGNPGLVLNQQGEWISVAGEIINVTFSQLQTLISNNQLVGGSYYRITDFQTIYDQADYDNTGTLKTTITTKTEAVEPLIVFALNNNTISSQVWSETHPNDKLQYDVNYTSTFINGNPAKGKIIERIDEWNNRTDYDHRTVKFIRYEDPVTNRFTVINDNGGTRQEFLTFGNTYATNSGEVIRDNFIGNVGEYSDLLGFEFANNVFHFETEGYGNKLGISCYNNTWGDVNYSNTWGDTNYSNTWGNDNNSNTWGNDNNLNTWGDNNDSNTWGDSNGSNTWGDSNGSNTWGDVNYSNTWGDSNGSNTWGDNNGSNTWGDSNYSNTWGYNNSSNTWGNNSFSNTWGSSNEDNIWGNSNQNNELKTFITNKDFSSIFELQAITYVSIFTASTNNVYYRYFDGTNDITTQII